MVSDSKIKAVDELAEKVSKSRSVGIVNIANIPSNTLQQMRKTLKGKAELKVAKGSIMSRALQKAKTGNLEEHMKGQPAVIFSDLDPFKLSKLVRSTRTSAPAKTGSILERDIVVPAGDTPFKAGPIIGDLQKVGIKAKIQGGKIVVTDDSTVVKKGVPVTADQANVLARLNITPLELGLDMRAAYEAGMIYTKDALDIDEESLKVKLAAAYANSFNLSYNARIYTEKNVGFFMRKAFTEAMSLAINTEVVNEETISALLSKANMQMLSLASQVPGGVSEELSGAASSAASAPAAEEKKEEEKPKEEDAAAGLASLFD